MSRRPAAPASSSSFLFVTCQAGAEAVVKEEVARALPGARPAFHKRGFVTFKSDAPFVVDVDLPAVFVRASGICLGAFAEPELVDEIARFIGTRRAHVHVFPRERHLADAIPVDAPDAWAASDRLAASLRSDLPALRAAGDVVKDGDLVIDVIDVEATEGGSKGWWLGAHVHHGGHARFPGGDPRVVVPAHSPSRAWKKLEEMAALYELPIRSGDHVVEVGCCPGGVSTALLDRGCSVVGVDPGEMDARVLQSGRFQHIRVPGADADLRAIARPVDWLVLDVNISPYAALRTIEPYVRFFERDLHGVMLTLKLGEWHMAKRAGHMLSIVRAFGPDWVEMHAQQLPSNGREFTVVALTEKGAARRP